MKAIPPLVLVWVASLVACVDDPELDDGLAASEQAIEDGDLATQFRLDRAAKLRNCTATRISRDHVLTALHCAPKVGDTVTFYANGPGADGGTRKVHSVALPPGTSLADGDEDWSDSQGRLADIAVVELDRTLASSTVATMAWLYPGIDHGGLKVGAGSHEGDPNPTGILRTKYDVTWTDNDESGGFYTSEYALNGGDSGGAFYDGSNLLGVTHGGHLIGVWRGRFTSVPEHLLFILDAIDYEWGGDPVESKRRTGPQHATFSGGLTRCKYACERTAGCAAFNHHAASSTCTMLSSVTSTSASSTNVSARK